MNRITGGCDSHSPNRRLSRRNVNSALGCQIEFSAFLNKKLFFDSNFFGLSVAKKFAQRKGHV